MKKILLIYFLTFSSAILAQPNFAYYYSPGTQVSYNLAPYIARCSDGIVGISIGSGISNGFLIFKTDFNGNMLWKKGFSITPTFSFGVKVIPLSDNTLGIYIPPMGGSIDFMLIKCDLSGNILWSNTYSSTTAFSLGGNIVPYSNGGIMFTDLRWVAFINSSGTVDNAYTLPANTASMFDVAAKGPDSFTIWGTTATVVTNYFLFDINSAGTVTNSFTYALSAGDSSTTGALQPSRLISKTSSGGSYTTFTMKGLRAGLFYFNDQNQPVWGKKIGYTNNVQTRTVNACQNNGCVINSQVVYSSSSNSIPLVMRFDSTGNMVWTKTPGDHTNTNWNWYNILFMEPDQSNGWYSALSTNNFPLVHSDSVFSGFCNYENYVPTVTSVTLTPTAATMPFTPIAFLETAMPVTVVTQSLYRYNACTGAFIDSLFTSVPEAALAGKNSAVVYPNPASENITIVFSSPLAGQMTGILNNTVGQTVARFTFEEGIQEKKENISNLPEGLYYLTVEGIEGKWVTKILKR